MWKIFNFIVLSIFVIACSDSEFNSNSAKKASNKASADASNALPDLDNNGIPDALEDKDGDGIPDGYIDTDGDGVPDALPKGFVDTDGDGKVDSISGSASKTSDSISGSTSTAKIEGLASVTDCDIAKAKGFLNNGVEVLKYEGNSGFKKQCNWSGEDAGRVHGRKKWDKTLEFSPTMVVCSMEFSSSGRIEYDDAILLTLNDKALLWGSLEITKLNKVDGLYQYDFSMLKGARQGGDLAQHSCVDGFTSCEVPKTETVGDLRLSFNEETNLKLMKTVEEVGAKFTLRAFGDDDPDKDCTHSGLDLTVKYTYFNK